MSDNEKDFLSKAFDVEPISRPEVPVVFPEKPDDVARRERFEEYVDADYSFARENIMGTILKAQDALDQIIDLAQASDQPRAYEVVSTMVNVIVDANKDLLELAKRNKELRRIESQTPASQLPNNSGTQIGQIFIGSTDELQKLLKNEGLDTGLRTINVTPKERDD